MIGYGVIRRGRGCAPQPALRVGEHVVPFAGDSDLADEVTCASTLNPYLELGPDVWAATLAFVRDGFLRVTNYKYVNLRGVQYRRVGVLRLPGSPYRGEFLNRHACQSIEPNPPSGNCL